MDLEYPLSKYSLPIGHRISPKNHNVSRSQSFGAIKSRKYNEKEDRTKVLSILIRKKPKSKLSKTNRYNDARFSLPNINKAFANKIILSQVVEKSFKGRNNNNFVTKRSNDSGYLEKMNNGIFQKYESKSYQLKLILSIYRFSPNLDTNQEGFDKFYKETISKLAKQKREL